MLGSCNIALMRTHGLNILRHFLPESPRHQHEFSPSNLISGYTSVCFFHFPLRSSRIPVFRSSNDSAPPVECDGNVGFVVGIELITLGFSS